MQTLSRESRFESLPFLKLCTEALRSGYDFASAWQISLESSPVMTGREAGERLREFGRIPGASDLSAQLKGCALYESYFADLAARERENYEKNKRLYPILSAAAGLGLALAVL